MKKIRNSIVMVTSSLALLGLTACETHTQQGALYGGLGGAAVGGIVDGGKGALVGGALGAAAGAAIGSSKDRQYGYRY